MAAHDEEVVIAESLAAIIALLPADQVHVVSDGSTDRTVELAERAGAHVISTRTNIGKAGALEEAVERFDLVARFDYVLILDADTRVQPGYFEAALPLFADPGVAAVAGAVRSSWDADRLSLVGKVICLPPAADLHADAAAAEVRPDLEAASTPRTSCRGSPACTGRGCCPRSR